MKKIFLPILLVLAFVGVCYAQFGGPMPTTNTNPQVTTTPSPNNVPQAYNNGQIDAGWLPWNASTQIPANYIANLSELQITNLITDLASKAVLPGWTSPQTGVITGTPPTIAPAPGNPDFWFDSSNMFNLGYGLNTNGPINTPGPVSIGTAYQIVSTGAQLTAALANNSVTGIYATGLLTGLSGAVNVTKPFSAGRYRVFPAGATVTFSAGTVDQVCPEWWTGNTSPGTTDMTTAVSSAVASLGTGPGTVSFGASTYLITSGITEQYQGQRIIGQGKTSTFVLFNPISNNTVLFTFKLPTASTIISNSLKDLTIESTDTTHVKTAVQCTDIDNFSMSDVVILYINDSTYSSVGLLVQGRDLSSFRDLYIVADNPIQLGVDPNIATIGTDVMNFHNIKLFATSQNPNFSIASGCYVTNLSITGSNFMSNGGAGIQWQDTLTTGNSQNIYVENLRWEWDSGATPTGYMIDLEPNSPLVGATFVNCYTAQPNAFKFNNIERCALINCQALGSSGVALNASSTTYPLVLTNFYNPQSETVTLTGLTPQQYMAQNGNISSAVYTNGSNAYSMISTGTFQNLPNSATPSVAGASWFINSNTTTISNFTGGVQGQIIHIIAYAAFTIYNNSTIYLNGSTNYAMSLYSTLTLINYNGNWFEIGRSAY